MSETAVPSARMESTVKPIQFGFGQIRHKRLRPAVNAFAYPGWFLRLPVRHLAAQHWRTGLPGLSLGEPGQRGRFSVLARDHGDGKHDLLSWVEGVLAQASIQDADGEIWLHTFPRVLGYVFNPVSFWFCHRRDGQLRAIVCEVNNTFSERHCYLLANADGQPLRNGQRLQAEKVFHVSPFCQVTGHYVFQFVFAGNTAGDIPARFLARIDHHDANGPLLLTSISGTLQAADARTVAHAFWRYPWLTFGVIARIHWQALKLWCKKVPFFRKPALPNQFITRNQ
ncbi:DUF1365 domain-containing protein [Parvibium lacunae]|uniref:DUF1365 domain-containing protein n=1 Tax=Parvibium lacunae TaxID=1888893 RepID=A0A368L0Q5_9BURK|nr:DUF1365 domain-containing protein [Parvibium lacunae]RCS57138.1 DUF1365 domain-containing protein [Parvibium lacunae]